MCSNGGSWCVSVQARAVCWTTPPSRHQHQSRGKQQLARPLCLLASEQMRQYVAAAQLLPSPVAGQPNSHCVPYTKAAVELSCQPCDCFPLTCSTESSKKKPPIYKVMLHNDNYNRREYVVKILLKTVEGLTVDDAVNVMQVGAQFGRLLASCVSVR